MSIDNVINDFTKPLETTDTVKISYQKVKFNTDARSKLRPLPEFKFNEAQRDTLVEIFSLFEKDLKTGFGEGRISTKHIKLILRALHLEPNQEDLNTLFHTLDPKKEGYISISDFAEIFQWKMRDKSHPVEFSRAFKLIDTQNKGFITLKDLKRVSREIGDDISEEELQEMIEEADHSENGFVNEKDFNNLMEKMQEYSLNHK